MKISKEVQKGAPSRIRGELRRSIRFLQLSRTISMPISFRTWAASSNGVHVHRRRYRSAVCAPASATGPRWRSLPVGAFPYGAPQAFGGEWNGAGDIDTGPLCDLRIRSQTISTFLKSVPVGRILAFCIEYSQINIEGFGVISSAWAGWQCICRRRWCFPYPGLQTCRRAGEFASHSR